MSPSSSVMTAAGETSLQAVVPPEVCFLGAILISFHYKIVCLITGKQSGIHFATSFLHPLSDISAAAHTQLNFFDAELCGKLSELRKHRVRNAEIFNLLPSSSRLQHLRTTLEQLTEDAQTCRLDSLLMLVHVRMQTAVRPSNREQPMLVLREHTVIHPVALKRNK